jgi:hypothetical protein
MGIKSWKYIHPPVQAHAVQLLKRGKSCKRFVGDDADLIVGQAPAHASSQQIDLFSPKQATKRAEEDTEV